MVFFTLPILMLRNLLRAKKSVLYSNIIVNLRGIQYLKTITTKRHILFWGSTLSNIVKVVMILALLLFDDKALEAARPPLNVMKPKLGKIKVSVSSKDRAPVQSSASNP